MITHDQPGPAIDHEIEGSVHTAQGMSKFRMAMYGDHHPGKRFAVTTLYPATQYPDTRWFNRVRGDFPLDRIRPVVQECGGIDQRRYGSQSQRRRDCCRIGRQVGMGRAGGDFNRVTGVTCRVDDVNRPGVADLPVERYLELSICIRDYGIGFPGMLVRNPDQTVGLDTSLPARDRYPSVLCTADDDESRFWSRRRSRIEPNQQIKPADISVEIYRYDIDLIFTLLQRQCMRKTEIVRE